VGAFEPIRLGGALGFGNTGDVTPDRNLGIYVTPNSGVGNGGTLTGGGFTARNTGYGVGDTAGAIAPGTIAPGSRTTGFDVGIGGTYNASYLVGHSQQLFLNGEVNFVRSNTTIGTSPDLIALGFGTSAGSIQSNNYSFVGSALYINNKTYVVAKGGYGFGHGTEFQAIDGSTGRFNSDAWFADARLGHLFLLVDTRTSAPAWGPPAKALPNAPARMPVKAPPMQDGGYAIGLDLSGHVGYLQSQIGSFVDSTGLIFGANRVHFGDAGLKAKLVAAVQSNGVIWMPYIAGTVDRQFGFSHTSIVPDQAAFVGGDVLSFTQGLTALGAQVGLDAQARNGWIVGVKGFYSHTSDTEIIGGRAYVKIPFGPSPVASRY
jgi:hypothetical protein